MAMKIKIYADLVHITCNDQKAAYLQGVMTGGGDYEPSIAAYVRKIRVDGTALENTDPKGYSPPVL